MEPNYRYKLPENRHQEKKKPCYIRILKNVIKFYDAPSLWYAAELLRRKLSPEKRKHLTLCTMLSNDSEELVELTDIALNAMKLGMPLPPFFSAADDAQWWSERASPSELEAYAVNCLLRLSKKRQRDFVNYVMRRVTDG